tara:strand:- start:3591 stop:4775 length:1185 start_codon:yes stop_codon:yes gene_type:complete
MSINRKNEKTGIFAKDSRSISNNRVYLGKNVFDESLDRIRYLFDEFENVVVGFSGGKDSTTCLELSLIVAKEKNRLPLKVMFLDQEAEWQCTIDYVEEVMNRPDVEPLWFQIPLKIGNSASLNEEWHYCWDVNTTEWMREKSPMSIHDNVYGSDRFADLFTKIFAKDFKDKKACYISGVRCEESPARNMALTGQVTYKGITWGKNLSKKEDHYTFYPIYDWSVWDVWVGIFKGSHNYNKLYDYYYQNGKGIKKMRVSNVHHETAINDLPFMQEIEKDTWNKIVERIDGANTSKHMDNWFPNELPYMFDSWDEYRDHLLEHIIKEELKPAFRKKFKKFDKAFHETPVYIKAMKCCIKALLINDYHSTIMGNFLRSPFIYQFNRTRVITGYQDAKK